jgi:hypothetical protein
VQLRSGSCLLVLVGVLLVPVGARAIPLVDQEQPFFDTSFPPLRIGGPLGDKLAQTFTVGRSGYPIEVQLPVQCESGMLIVEIFPVEAGRGSAAGRSSGVPIDPARGAATRARRSVSSRQPVVLRG